MSLKIEAYIDAIVSTLDLRLEPEWRPAIKANVEVTIAMGRLVDDFKLPDISEPAPVYVS
jgi:hypothetical protein